MKFMLFYVSKVCDAINFVEIFFYSVTTKILILLFENHACLCSKYLYIFMCHIFIKKLNFYFLSKSF